ncbi:MAG: hypothetical protein ABTQ73_09775 [Caldilineales bacterium]
MAGVVVITQRNNSLLWTGVAVLMALAVLMRMFLALEEMETGVRFPTLGWQALMWLFGLLLAVFADLVWKSMEAPVLTMIALAVGMAGGGTALVNSLLHHPAKADALAFAPTGDLSLQRAAVAMPFTSSQPLEAVTPDPYVLRVFLFGPMRVVRQGESLANTAEVWRSGKTRSLLVLLALRRHNGVTAFDIAEALWPTGAEMDGDADRKSQSAMRSYLSTLRRVLDPEPRSDQPRIVRDGERYFLRSEGLWLDLWEFETLVEQAEKLTASAAFAEALACWQQAVALYSPEGLLPDEMNLPAEIIELMRQRTQRCYLKGLRILAHAEAIDERAVTLWEALNQADPFDNEALRWLVSHYQNTSDRRKLLELLQHHPDAQRLLKR